MSSIVEELSWLPKPIVLSTDEEYRRLLERAYKHGNIHSPDPSTKNGAILVTKGGVTCVNGVNKFPDGIEETEERLIDKPTKYRLVVHAENGAIFNAAKWGNKTRGSTIYCPFYACCECAKAIIQSGVKRVVGHAQLMALAKDHTVWVKSIVDAWNMLHEAGVKCELYNGTVGVTTRFNGEDISV